MSEKVTIPTPEEFLLEKGLYEKIELGEKLDYEIGCQIIELEFFNEAIRTYCPDCNQESSFRTDLLKTNEIYSQTKPHILQHGEFQLKNPSEVIKYMPEWNIKIYAFEDKTFTLEFYCTYNHKHRIFFTFNIKDHVIQKIGQFPSIADSMELELKEYKKVLEKELGSEKSQELSKAIGLYSHGIGIGSFVYLRRIFEAFIYQAKDEALSKSDLNEEDFNKARMSDKIELLKEYLPEVIVENKTIYSVLSKGIHELSEDECKKHFNVIRLGIELILDEKIAKRTAQEKKNKFTKELSSTHQEISS